MTGNCGPQVASGRRNSAGHLCIGKANPCVVTECSKFVHTPWKLYSWYKRPKMKKWKIFSSTGSRSHPGKLSLQPPNSLQQKNSERCAAKESECTRCTKGTGCTQSTGYTQGTGLGIHTVLGIHKVLGAHKVRSEHKGSINLYSHRGYKRVGAGFLLAHTKTYPLMLQNIFLQHFQSRSLTQNHASETPIVWPKFT